MNSTTVSLIFGMKIRQARLKSNLSANEFATKVKISRSYLTEIEKGRKYPKAEKIFKMAEVLGKEYDDLVSIKLDPGLIHLEKALNSPIIQQFPYRDFGMDKNFVVEMLMHAPKEASALVHAVGDLARYADLEEDHLFRAMLRSYQEIQHNYFEDIEISVEKFLKEFELTGLLPVTLKSLENILIDDFNLMIDKSKIANSPELSIYRSLYIEGEPPELLINSKLNNNQIKFNIAREIGYKYLQLEERSITSSPDEINSFQQVLNDFKASYFAGALLMPKNKIAKDIEILFGKNFFDSDVIYTMLFKYDVTPEMLFYRFSEIIPKFFNMPVHFLRTHSNGSDFQLIKYLNMTGVSIPAGLKLNEQFCRRWLNIRLLNLPESSGDINFGTQISNFHDSNEQYLCFGFVNPHTLSSTIKSSVVLGIRIDGLANKIINFIGDPEIPSTVVNETCERCPLSTSECDLRAAPSSIYDKEQTKIDRWKSIDILRENISKD